MRINLYAGQSEAWYRLASTLNRWLYVTGISMGGSYGWSHEGRSVGVYFIWGPRSYVLWRPRHFWFHTIRRGHSFYPIIPGEHFIDCGKCVPWPCCGSPDEGHRSDCEDADVA